MLKTMTMRRLEAKDMPWKITLLDHFMGVWVVRDTERFATEGLAREWAALQISAGGIGGVYVEHDAKDD